MDREDNQGKIFSKIGIIFFLMVFLIQVSQGIMYKLVMIFCPHIMEKPWFLSMVTIISVYLCAFPIYLLFMRSVPGQKPEAVKKYKVHEIAILFVICLAFTYIFNVCTMIFTFIIELFKNSTVVNPLEGYVNSSGMLYTFLTVCIIAPIIEEIIFRKVLIEKLIRFGELPTLIVSSLIFALFHGNLHQIFYAFALGFLFGYIAIKSGTVKYTIILHVLINTFGTIIMPFLALSQNPILSAFAGFLVMVILGVGISLFILFRKSLFPPLVIDEPIPFDDDRYSIVDILRSPGMLIFILTSLVMVVLNTFLV